LIERPPERHARLLLYGILLIYFGLAVYMLGVVMSVPRYLVGNPRGFLYFNELIVWYSGMPIAFGLTLAAVDLFVLLGAKRSQVQGVRHDALPDQRLVVVLTAYDDEASIAEAVQDFRAHPLVDKVVVVSNNSRDATLERAREAGASAINEMQQGYGRCVYRCFEEAIACGNPLIVLCEGDRTFRAYDLDKFLAYAPHADIVNGTRTVERLRDRFTQLSTFMYYGNLFVGKLLEAKHLGRCTITDVGTTYKLCRREALIRLMPHLRPAVNLEFNPHFLDVALERGCDIVECPITLPSARGREQGRQREQRPGAEGRVADGDRHRVQLEGGRDMMEAAARRAAPVLLAGLLLLLVAQEKTEALRLQPLG